MILKFSVHSNSSDNLSGRSDLPQRLHGFLNYRILTWSADRSLKELVRRLGYRKTGISPAANYMIRWEYCTLDLLISL